jgi:hypothetical protein
MVYAVPFFYITFLENKKDIFMYELYVRIQLPLGLCKKIAATLMM